MTRKSNIALAGRALAVVGTVLSGVFLLGTADTDRARGVLTPGELGRVSSIVDGDTLFVDESLKVRLSAIQAPKLPLGRPGFKEWPLANEAKAALTGLAYGKSVELHYGGETRDRYDRALAQVFMPDLSGIWLQEEMVRLGWARVYTWPDTWQDAPRLYRAEREARANKRGIWSHPFYEIRTPDPNNLAQDVDSFQIVEGIITSAADVRGRIYLNFGADYRTDFTIAIAKRDRKRFKQSKIDPMSLEGARVRVRGWIELQNGPVIWLDHPERLEILD